MQKSHIGTYGEGIVGITDYNFLTIWGAVFNWQGYFRCPSLAFILMHAFLMPWWLIESVSILFSLKPKYGINLSPFESFNLGSVLYCVSTVCIRVLSTRTKKSTRGLFLFFLLHFHNLIICLPKLNSNIHTVLSISPIQYFFSCFLRPGSKLNICIELSTFGCWQQTGRFIL